MKNNINIKKNKIVADLWGRKESTNERYGQGFHWIESPIVKNYINKNITGDVNLDWVTNFFNKYLMNISGAMSCLSLGCGVGNLERHLCSLGSFKTMDAIDLAKGALKQFKKNAQKLGYSINYKLENLNTIKLPDNTYDVIFANMSLHHVRKLEHLINEVEESLAIDCQVLNLLNRFCCCFKNRLVNRFGV